MPQLYDLDRRVALEAVEILDEACEEEVNTSHVWSMHTLYTSNHVHSALQDHIHVHVERERKETEHITTCTHVHVLSLVAV